MTQTHVSLTKQIGDQSELFHFRTKTAEEGIDKLDALVDAGTTDYDKLRDELKEYIISPRKKSTKQKDDKVTEKTEKKSKTKKVSKKVKNESAIKTKRARGDNNEKRQKALAMFSSLLAEGSLDSEHIIKRVQTELGMTYANTYYYWSTVFNKGQKASEPIAPTAETAPAQETVTA